MPLPTIMERFNDGLTDKFLRMLIEWDIGTSQNIWFSPFAIMVSWLFQSDNGR